MTSIEQAKQKLIDKFELLDDWLDKYQLLISMGKNTSSFPARKMTDSHLMTGCQSRVWLDTYMQNGRLQIEGTSDAAIVSGLIAVLISIYNNQPPEEIVNTSTDFIDELGLRQHLSLTRSNGLNSMLQTIYSRALEAAA